MSTNKPTTKYKFLCLLSVIGLFLFFFIDGPTSYHNQVHLLFWNNGHILFFSSVSILLHLKFEHNLKLSPYILSFIVAVLLGVLIELIQSKIGRELDWNDVYLGLLGALLINTYYFVKKKTSATSLILLLLAISFIIEQQKLLFTAIKMEYLINARFPTLAAFGSNNDLSNWSGESLSIVTINSISTNKILKATFIENQQYSTLTLHNFYKNWVGYHALNASLYLEGNEDIKLCIKITDMIHDTGNQAYGDRFDYCTLLTPKKNNIIIPINDIKTSPELRYLDLKNISEITFFAMNLTSKKIVYIKDIKLQ